jgi:hypothetical protein
MRVKKKVLRYLVEVCSLLARVLAGEVEFIDWSIEILLQIEYVEVF